MDFILLFIMAASASFMIYVIVQIIGTFFRGREKLNQIQEKSHGGSKETKE